MTTATEISVALPKAAQTFARIEALDWQEIAKNLRAVSREYDTVGRLGGDEFVLVLPDFDADSVKEFLPRLLSAFEAAGETICGQKVISASVGVAFHPKDGVTAEDLLSEADRSMYESKDIHYRGKGQLLRSQLVDTLEG